jgi:hypothetical protein
MSLHSYYRIALKAPLIHITWIKLLPEGTTPTRRSRWNSPVPGTIPASSKGRILTTIFIGDSVRTRRAMKNARFGRGGTGLCYYVLWLLRLSFFLLPLLQPDHVLRHNPPIKLLDRQLPSLHRHLFKDASCGVRALSDSCSPCRIQCVGSVP